MHRCTTLVATLAVLAGSAYAADEQYQWEVSGAYMAVTTDEEPEVESTVLGVEGIYHVMGPVALADHPWEEAAFLEHSSYAGAMLGRATIEAGEVEADGFTYGVFGRYADKEVPVSVDLSLEWASVEDDDFDVEVDTFTWDLRGGYWVMPNLNAGLGYESSSSETSGDEEFTDTQLYAWGKWVHALNEELDLNVEAQLGQISYDASGDENMALSANADIYFRKQYGVGLILGTESGDEAASEGNTFGIEGSAWFTPNIGVRASYATFAASDEDEGVDDDTISLEVVGRF